MPFTSAKKAMVVLLLVILGLGVAWFGWPRPLGVDIALVKRGAMEVTVDEEAKTRVRHVYTVSAPIAGRVLRISPPRHVGDEVSIDDAVAVMQPTTPSFHDARTHDELLAAMKASEAAVKLAEADVRRVEATANFARAELDRAQTLSRSQSISLKALDKAKFDAESSEAALLSAKAQVEVKRYELASVASRVEEPSNVAPRSDMSCCIQLRSPATGRILKIIQESEGVVQAGASLIEVGNPSELEVVAELLSSDAVRSKPGAPVLIDGWGGPALQGRVRRVDPAGFSKVSALGLEEQRVRTVIDFDNLPEAKTELGHDFRVIVHISIWRSEDALTVPIGALFRTKEDWAVFVANDATARTREVKIGQRNNQVAQVLSGLSAGDRVILHPSDRVKDGVAVTERPSR